MQLILERQYRAGWSVQSCILSIFDYDHLYSMPVMVHAVAIAIGRHSSQRRTKANMKQPVSLLTIMLICIGLPCFAADKGANAPLNFDTQIIHIFEAAQTADSEPLHEASPDDRTTLARILKKLRHHQLVLKNVVYRTDTAVLRITWADDHNDDVIKAAYKTGKDRILSNSLYADKGQV